MREAQPPYEVIQVCHAFLSIMSWHVDGWRRNRKPNSMNRKPKTTSDTKSEKPLVLLLKTENQMPKKGKTVNLNRRQNGETEGFRWKSQLKISAKPKRKPFWVYSSLLVWHKCYGNKEETNTYCYCWDYFFFIIITTKGEY